MLIFFSQLGSWERIVEKEYKMIFKVNSQLKLYQNALEVVANHQLF